MKTFTPEAAAAFLTVVSSGNSTGDRADFALPQVTAASARRPLHGGTTAELTACGGEILCGYTDGGYRGTLEFTLTVSGIGSAPEEEGALRNLAYSYRDCAELCLPYVTSDGIRIVSVRVTKRPELIRSAGCALSYSTGFRITYQAAADRLPDAVWMIGTENGFCQLHWFRAMNAGDGAITADNRYFNDPGVVSVLTGKRQKIDFRFDRVCGDPGQDTLLAVSDAEALGDRAAARLCFAVREAGNCFKTFTGMFSVSVGGMTFEDGGLIFDGKFISRGEMQRGTTQITDAGIPDGMRTGVL